MTNTTNRHADLMRQGFMKPLRHRAVRVKGPTVACDACLNWHEKGKHTEPKDVRAKNSSEARAYAARKALVVLP